MLSAGRGANRPVGAAVFERVASWEAGRFERAGCLILLIRAVRVIRGIPSSAVFDFLTTDGTDGHGCLPSLACSKSAPFSGAPGLPCCQDLRRCEI